MTTSNSKRPLILCVDDAEVALRIRKLLLSSAGYEVLTASSGEEGLELFRQFAVDMVVADHFLSDKSGSEIAAEMKQIKPAGADPDCVGRRGSTQRSGLCRRLLVEGRRPGCLTGPHRSTSSRQASRPVATTQQPTCKSQAELVGWYADSLTSKMTGWPEKRLVASQ